MNEKLARITKKKRQNFSQNLMNNPKVQQRLAQYAAQERAAQERAARRARAPKQMVTRAQAQPRRSGRLGG
jgi:hypothetical protein